MSYILANATLVKIEMMCELVFHTQLMLRRSISNIFELKSRFASSTSSSLAVSSREPLAFLTPRFQTLFYCNENQIRIHSIKRMI